MVKVNLYTAKGTKKSQVNLPSELLGDGSPYLVAQSVRVYSDNSHFGTSYAKTRAEVNATGAKVWRQKGTGNARHGSRRAPIFVGGGKAHGPKGIKRTLKLPEKMRQVAVKTALHVKARAGAVALVDGLDKLASTKQANVLINSLIAEHNLSSKVKVLVICSDKNKELVRFFRNITSVDYLLFRNLNALAIIRCGFLMLDNSLFEKANKLKAGASKLKTK